MPKEWYKIKETNTITNFTILFTIFKVTDFNKYKNYVSQ